MGYLISVTLLLRKFLFIIIICESMVDPDTRVARHSLLRFQRGTGLRPVLVGMRRDLTFARKILTQHLHTTNEHVPITLSIGKLYFIVNAAYVQPKKNMLSFIV